MAVYKNERTRTWYIKCYVPERGTATTIRRNPDTGNNFQTKKEAIDFEQRYLKGNVNIGITFDDLMKRYLDDHLGRRPSSSRDKVECWYKRNIKPVFGKKKAASLKSVDGNRMIKRMLDNDCSTIYINKMLAITKTVLNFAVEQNYIDKNPLAGIRPLKLVKNSEDVRYWTPAEMTKAIKAIPERFPSKTDQTVVRWLLSFAYFTGLRKGEIRALQWENIDFEKGIIRVDYHINEKGERAKGRKNGSGYTIVMDIKTRELLEEMNEYYSNLEGYDKNCYVFPSLRKGFNEPVGAHTPTRWMRQLAEYCELTPITFHGLRHSACSYWTSVVGLNPYEVADRLGDTVEVVLSVYASFFNDSKKAAAEKINKHVVELTFK